MTPSTTLISTAILITVLQSTPAHSCAGCSNPNLPSGQATSLVISPGELNATINMTATSTNVVHSEHCPDIGPICRMRSEPPQLHDLDFYVGELQTVFELGVFSWFSTELSVPIRITKTSVVFRRLDGMAFTPDYENIHHRNETLSGIGDPKLLGRANWEEGEFRYGAKLGLSLPLGSIEEDPFAAAENGLSHQHTQFGSGTFNPILALNAAWKTNGIELRGYGEATLHLYENKYGYRPGNRYMSGFAVGKRFSNASFELGTDLLNEQAERWGGVVQQDGNVGRTDLLVGVSIGVAFQATTAVLSIKSPVWQKFSEAGHTHDDEPSQLTYPAVLKIAVGRRFKSLW